MRCAGGWRVLDNEHPSTTGHSKLETKKIHEIFVPIPYHKHLIAVGTQVSFRAWNPTFQQEQISFCQQKEISDDQPAVILTSSPTQKNLQNFAKEEYKKWSQVDQLLARLTSKIGKGKTKDVNEIFNKIEELANQSKYSLKKNYNIQESQQSLLSLGKTPTLQSILQFSLFNL